LKYDLGCGQMASAGGPSDEVLCFIKCEEFVVCCLTGELLAFPK